MKTTTIAAALVIAIAGTLAASAQAQTVGLHLVSHHFPARDGLNNVNPGAYVRFDNGITLGAYRNTLRKNTLYVGETLEWNYVAVTLGVASGYQRTTTVTEQACPAGFDGRCWHHVTTNGSQAYLVPIVAPSVRLPSVFGATPRLTYMPATHGSVSVLHLSVEHSF